MKIKLVGFLMLIAALFTSCKKDAIDNTPASDQIKGTWKIHTIQARVYNGTQTNVEQIFDVYNGYDTPNEIITFGANNAFLYSTRGLATPMVGTYAIDSANNITTTTSPRSFNFAVITAAPTLLTLSETFTNYPGYPGKIVVEYHTLRRN
jgi:hypothetical protein